MKKLFKSGISSTKFLSERIALISHLKNISWNWFTYSRNYYIMEMLISRNFFLKFHTTQHSVEKWKLYSHWKKFRQINYLVILLVKPLLSRNFYQKRVRVNFRNFHTVHCVEKWKTYIVSPKKLRQINSVISLVKSFY